jgi:hypothetical protein
MNALPFIPVDANNPFYFLPARPINTPPFSFVYNDQQRVVSQTAHCVNDTDEIVSSG